MSSPPHPTLHHRPWQSPWPGTAFPCHQQSSPPLPILHHRPWQSPWPRAFHTTHLQRFLARAIQRLQARAIQRLRAGCKSWDRKLLAVKVMFNCMAGMAWASTWLSRTKGRPLAASRSSRDPVPNQEREDELAALVTDLEPCLAFDIDVVEQWLASGSVQRHTEVDVREGFAPST